MREEIQEVKQAVLETVDRLGRWVTALVSYLHPHKLNRTRARPSRMLATALGLLAARSRTRDCGSMSATAPMSPRCGPMPI